MSSSNLIQQACDPKRSVVVEACAGSGKTWLLVSRIVRLLLAGVKPHEILAITFTRKAAQEMGIRLETLLNEFRLMDDEGLKRALVDRGLSSEEAEALMPKARDLAEVVMASPRKITIDTFHGWFGRINQAAPIHGGVVQGAKLREDFKRLLEESLSEWWALLGRGQGEFAPLKAHFERLLQRMSFKSIQEILTGRSGLIAQRAAWMRFVQHSEKEGSSPLEILKRKLPMIGLPDPLEAVLKDKQELHRLRIVANELQKGGVREKDQGLAILAGLELIDSGADLNNVFVALRPGFLTGDMKELAVVANPTNGLVDALQLGSKITVDELIQVRKEWAIHLMRRCDWDSQNILYELNESWIALANSMLIHYAQAKEAMRVQDFSDIEWQAACLMEDELSSAYLQARLDAKFKHILIDEFQDTNPLQWQILEGWLSGYGADAIPPTIFMVGDPKQSIYRFRGADARLFTMVKNLLTSKFNAHNLLYDNTRRNAPAVCDAVNQVFTYAANHFAYAYPKQDTHWLNHLGKKEGGELICLPLIPYCEDEVEVGARNAIDEAYRPRKKVEGSRQHYEEALRIGRMIIAFKQSKEIHDQIEGKNTLRQVRWDDFLVLIRKKQYLLEIEQAFRELGLPCSTPRQGGLLKTLEGEDLTALLEVLLTPTNDLALAQVLRSPIFGVDEHYMQRLSIHSRDQHWWFALCRLEDDYSKAIVQQLKLWMSLALRLPVHDLLDQIYASGDIRRRYAARSPALEVPKVLANLDAFLRLALDADGGRYPSLSRFIDELRKLRIGEQDEGPDEGDTQDDQQEDGDMELGQSGAIRLMTIHSAKGLEAPFVFLMDTNIRARSNPGSGLIVDWEPVDPAPSLVSSYLSRHVSGNLTDSIQKEELIARREDWNLLYVAMTRAKEYLVISGVAKKPSTKEPSDCFSDSWYFHLKASGLPVAKEDYVESLFSKASLNAITNPKNAAVIFTDFGQGKWRDAQVHLQELVPGASAGLDERALADLGSAVHLILERFTSSPRIVGEFTLPSAKTIARHLGIASHLVEAARQIALNILNSEQLKGLIRSADVLEAWNELDLIDESGRLFRVDRLIEKEEGLYILDYKLSIPEESSEQFANYRAQLANYKKIIGRLRSDKPIKAFLVDGNGQLCEVAV